MLMVGLRYTADGNVAVSYGLYFENARFASQFIKGLEDGLQEQKDMRRFANRRPRRETGNAGELEKGGKSMRFVHLQRSKNDSQR